jgi:hypothetical protein
MKDNCAFWINIAISLWPMTLGLFFAVWFMGRFVFRALISGQLNMHDIKLAAISIFGPMAAVVSVLAANAFIVMLLLFVSHFLNPT